MDNQTNRDIRYLAEHLLYTDLSGLNRRELSHLMRISKSCKPRRAGKCRKKKAG